MCDVIHDKRLETTDMSCNDRVPDDPETVGQGDVLPSHHRTLRLYCI